MSTAAIRYVVRYEGRVQGVGFRFTALAQARGLDIHGFVRNEPDGAVLMDVEGKASDVKELLARIEMAMKGNIESTGKDPRPPRGLSDGFQIRH
ncbi:MAG: acylphosphatase [Rubripirellula sp.]